MGRSRRRARTAATTVPAPRAADRKRAAAAATATTAPDTALHRRRTLATYLAGAMLLAVLVLLGTITLAGALGPWIVLVTIGAAAFALHRWMRGRLAGVPLADEDRTLQLMATGLLVLALAFAAVAAVVLTVA